jgi:hypothetical protein
MEIAFESFAISDEEAEAEGLGRLQLSLARDLGKKGGKTGRKNSLLLTTDSDSGSEKTDMGVGAAEGQDEEGDGDGGGGGGDISREDEEDRENVIVKTDTG